MVVHIKLETYHTAVQYQMIHAIGLVLLGLLSLYMDLHNLYDNIPAQVPQVSS